MELEAETIPGDQTATGQDIDSQWAQFKQSNPMNAELMLRLIYMCDGRLAEATILWDMLEYYMAEGFDKWLTKNAIDIKRKYIDIEMAERSIRLAFSNLTTTFNFLEEYRGVPNTKKKYKLNLEIFLENFKTVAIRKNLPGFL